MSKRNLSYYCFCVILLLALPVSCIKEENELPTGTTLVEGDLLPTLSLELSDDTRVDNQRLEGKVSIILLFTTECPDCRKQLPHIEELHQRVKENPEILLFGISREQSASVLETYWQENDLTFPYSAQEDRSVYQLFASSVVPRIYISDTQRTIRYIFVEQLTGSDELWEKTETLLEE